MGGLLSHKRLHDTRKLSAIRPWFLEMRRLDEITPFVAELAGRLRITIGNPKVVVLSVHIRQIEHLLEVTANSANQSESWLLPPHAEPPG